MRSNPSRCAITPRCSTRGSPGASWAGETVRSAAGLALENIGYINAHGRGTIANDITETKALHTVFRGRRTGCWFRRRSQCTATRMLPGASGALEIVAMCSRYAMDSFRRPIITRSPTRGAISITCQTRGTEQVNVAISSSFAFGGHNAVLALRRYSP